jgi:GNAT superfamily N-acetyltransferase
VDDPPEVDTDLRIEQIGGGDADAFAMIVAQCLDWPETVGPWVALTVGRPGWKHYIAFDGSKPAATSALYVSGDFAWLDFASTMPDYRGRGAQSALIARRIRDAAELGCSHLVVETAEQTPDHPAPSYRNIVRFGFREAYKRANYIFEKP